MNTYKLLEPSYINGALLPTGAIVKINDNPNKGGMRPGKNLVAWSEDDDTPRKTPRKAEKSDEKVDDIA